MVSYVIGAQTYYTKKTIQYRLQYQEQFEFDRFFCSSIVSHCYVFLWIDLKEKDEKCCFNFRRHILITFTITNYNQIPG